jgi:hypothetical protein
MNVLISDHVARFGLNVKILDWMDFPGGRQYRQDEPFKDEILKGHRTPWILHMHYTKNIQEKIELLKESNIFWSIDDDKCNHDGIRKQQIHNGDGVDVISLECCKATI